MPKPEFFGLPRRDKKPEEITHPSETISQQERAASLLGIDLTPINTLLFESGHLPTATESNFLPHGVELSTQLPPLFDAQEEPAEGNLMQRPSLLILLETLTNYPHLLTDFFRTVDTNTHEHQLGITSTVINFLFQTRKEQLGIYGNSKIKLSTWPEALQTTTRCLEIGTKGINGLPSYRLVDVLQDGDAQHPLSAPILDYAAPDSHEPLYGYCDRRNNAIGKPETLNQQLAGSTELLNHERLLLTLIAQENETTQHQLIKIRKENPWTFEIRRDFTNEQLATAFTTPPSAAWTERFVKSKQATSTQAANPSANLIRAATALAKLHDAHQEMPWAATTEDAELISQLAATMVHPNHIARVYAAAINEKNTIIHRFLFSHILYDYLGSTHHLAGGDLPRPSQTTVQSATLPIPTQNPDH